MKSQKVRIDVENRRRTEDRRTTRIQYNRRNFDRRSATFKYERSIHLNDTNSFGSVYFATFFVLQGEAREEFLQFLLGDKLGTFIRDYGYNLVTVEATQKYYAPAFVYDVIGIDLTVPKITKAKVTMDFNMQRVNGGDKLAEGRQVIGFTTREGKPVPIPDIIIDSFKQRHILKT